MGSRGVAEFVTGLEWLFAPPGSRPPGWDRGRAAERAAQVLAGGNAALFEARSVRDELVGVASVYLDILSVRFGRRASIEDLAVQPDWRSRGVGARLLATARTWAQARAPTTSSWSLGWPVPRRTASTFTTARSMPPLLSGGPSNPPADPRNIRTPHTRRLQGDGTVAPDRAHSCRGGA